MNMGGRRVCRLAGLLCAAVVLNGGARVVEAQAVAAPPPAAQKPPASPKPRAPGTGAAAAAEFDRLIKAGTEARQAERWEEAIGLYAKAVKLKPGYVEGYWYQGTAYYSLDDYTNCRETFRKVVRLAPKNGAAYAFLGLCEFGLKDYERSLQHLLQSRILGVGDTQDLGNIARYHAAILMTRIDQHEQALETLGEFAGAGNDNPRVIEAMGLATLRMALLPTEAPPERREMVLMAGRASYMMATRNTAAAAAAFETLAARYPETPNVHYAYGVFLLQEQPDKALEEFKRELELQPGHPSSLMQMAYEYSEAGRRAGRAAVGAAVRGRRSQRVPRAQGARPGAARDRRCRRRHQGAADRHQARAGEPGPALHARARLPARRTAGGCRARA